MACCKVATLALMLCQSLPSPLALMKPQAVTAALTWMDATRAFAEMGAVHVLLIDTIKEETQMTPY
jgi:hypothetical protein